LEGEFAGRYVELILTYMCTDRVEELTPEKSRIKTRSWEYEFSIAEDSGQKVVEVRLPGARQPFKEGTAAPNVVTAYEKLLKQIEDEKSSKQQRHAV